MKRVEFQDLRPGDTFEYEVKSPVVGVGSKMKRDTVKPLGDGRWRLDGAPSVYHTMVDGESVATSRFAIRLFTEVGQTNHHWVQQPNDTVVVLIEDGDS